MLKLPVKNVSIISLILLLSSSLLLTGCGSTSGAAQAAIAPTPEAITPVEVATAETGDISLIFSYTGNLQAKDEVKLMPGASGRVETVLVKVGDAVKAGDPLATLERDVYLLQLKQAQAGLTAAQLKLERMKMGSRPEEIAVAQAALELARAALNDIATINDNERTTAAAALANAQAGLRRAQADYDKIAWAGNVGTTQQASTLEQATNGYEAALAGYNLQTNPSDAQLAPLQAQVVQAELRLALTKQPFLDIDFQMAKIAIDQAQTAVDMVNRQLDETTIKAPFDGLISELSIVKGSMVGPQAAVATIVSDKMELAVGVEESRIGQITIGQNASLQVDAYPGQDFPAAVTSISPVADKNTHTFTVKVTPTDGQTQLRAGMFADLSVLAQEKKGVLLAPMDAVTEINGQPTIYVVNGNRVEQRAVTTGLSDGDRVEITSGLEAGETVVIAGQSNLTDGAKVETVNKL